MRGSLEFASFLTRSCDRFCNTSVVNTGCASRPCTHIGVDRRMQYHVREEETEEPPDYPHVPCGGCGAMDERARCDDARQK